MPESILKDWHTEELDTELKEIGDKLREVKAQGKIVLPRSNDILNAFNYCPKKECKVVIIGQDPYHTVTKDGEVIANGLCFSSNKQGFIPPSLRNILAEKWSDIHANEFDLSQTQEKEHNGWGKDIAEQGVLMLNTALTVEQSSPNIHSEMWSKFTTLVLESLSSKENLVWILWGKHAQSFKHLIPSNHKIIEAPHPSPFSAHRGFFGHHPFSKCNTYLRDAKLQEITW